MTSKRRPPPSAVRRKWPPLLLLPSPPSSDRASLSTVFLLLLASLSFAGSEYSDGEDDPLDASPRPVPELNASLDLEFTRNEYDASIPENSMAKTFVVPTEKMGIRLSSPDVGESLSIR
jgi:hypothetical protein